MADVMPDELRLAVKNECPCCGNRFDQELLKESQSVGGCAVHHCCRCDALLTIDGGALRELTAAEQFELHLQVPHLRAAMTLATIRNRSGVSVLEKS